MGYATVAEDGVVVEANLRAADLFGQPRAALVGRPFSVLVAAADQDALFLCTRRLRSGEGRPEVELRLRRSSGDEVWARCEWLLVERDGEPRRSRVTLSDVTEHKRLQAPLALADRLASVGLLAGSISHEVNNPLTYLLFNLETLAEELPALVLRLAGPGSGDVRPELDEMVEMLASAQHGARRIRDLVKGLRAFASVEEDLVEPLPFNALLRTALDLTASEIRGRARLVTELGEVPRVSANHGQMCQVFVNLLVNAAHSIEPGDVDGNEIRVRTWSEAGEVFAEIADTGCGIAPEDLGRIFDPFFTTRGIGSGTGLGLSIGTKIVSSLGGQLSVESKVGRGSRFTVRLPAESA